MQTSIFQQFFDAIIFLLCLHGYKFHANFFALFTSLWPWHLKFFKLLDEFENIQERILTVLFEIA